jgi:hypothetical protein
MTTLKYEKHREISSPPQEGTKSILPFHALRNALQNWKLWITVSDRSALATGGRTSRMHASVVRSVAARFSLKGGAVRKRLLMFAVIPADRPVL